jgi:hypothetical protein
MVHNRLRKQIIKAAAIQPIVDRCADVKDRISLRAADRVAGSTREK